MLCCLHCFGYRVSIEHGAGTDSLTLDFATIVYRLQLLGFNAVRLPFSFSDLYDKQPLSQQRNCAQVCSPSHRVPFYQGTDLQGCLSLGVASVE